MKIRTGSVSIIPAAVLICMLPGCVPSETGWQGKIESRGRVTIVHNPKFPLYPGPVLELTEDLTIGEVETEDRLVFHDIRTLDVDLEGNIYVLDEGAADIKVFNQSGEHLRTIGRQGQGPGEFAFPISVFVTPQTELLVHDMNQRSLKVLDREGNFLRQVSIADKFQFSGPRFLPEGGMVGSYLVPAQQPLAELVLFDSELKPVRTLVSRPVEPPPVLHYFAGNSMTGLRWNINDRGEVIWGDFLESEYRLFICNSQGEHIRTIEREYDNIRITESDKEPLLRKMFGGNPLPPQWDIRVPDRYPPFSGISCDDSGHIFVKTYGWNGKEIAEAYDVFDAEGRYMAQVTLPVPFMVMKENFLYTIVENADGFHEVKRFNVNWFQKF